MNYGFAPLGNKQLRRLDPNELKRKKSKKIMRTSITLPSQYQSYAICTEFAKEWFLEKFKSNFFNSVYVDGTFSFDEFRKFSTIDQQMLRANPLLAIVPNIDISYNRQWIDSQPDMPLMLRRSKIEGTFFNDEKVGLYCQLTFKTILMNFLFKIRVDTRAEELDLVEFIKLYHRAGYTESREIAIDVHVPKPIIRQIAFDNGFKITDNGEIEQPARLLAYLNSHSYIPFIYKLRCASGTNEFFLKVPNCMAHIKSELPTMDDGERQDMLTTNYQIDFQVEIEMTAPYCYTYYSRHDKHAFITDMAEYTEYSKIAIMSAIKTQIPALDEHGWDLFTTTEYEVDDNTDLNEPLDIDFAEFFNEFELGRIINYTKKIMISPEVFMSLHISNGGLPMLFTMDWDKVICHIYSPTINRRTVIAIYCDRQYINDTLMFLDEAYQDTRRVKPDKQ